MIFCLQGLCGGFSDGPGSSSVKTGGGSSGSGVQIRAARQKTHGTRKSGPGGALDDQGRTLRNDAQRQELDLGEGPRSGRTLHFQVTQFKTKNY